MFKQEKGFIGRGEYNIFPSEIGCSLGIEHHGGHFMVMLVNGTEGDPERDGQRDSSYEEPPAKIASIPCVILCTSFGKWRVERKAKTSC